MKDYRSLQVLLVSLLAVTFLCASPAIAGTTESCEAPDGTCSASATCDEGEAAYAVCWTGGPCQAGCISKDDGALQQTALAPSPWPGIDKAVISLQLDMADGEEVGVVLSEALGREVRFVPRNEDALVNLHVHQMPVSQLLDLVSPQGQLSVDGRVYRATVEGHPQLTRRVNLSVKDMSVSQLEALLTRTLGLPVTLDLERESVTLSVTELTGYQLLQLLARSGEVRVDGRSMAPLP